MSAAFDRVEIKIGGILGALQSLRIYDVQRKMPAPVTTLTLGGLHNNGSVCLNQVSGTVFTVTNAEATCAVYTWHDSATHNPVNGASSDGLSFTPPITTAGTYKYYVKVSRNGCTNSTAQSPISITVNPLPEEPVIPPVTVCIGQPATLTISNAASGVTYAWYTTSSGGSPLSNPISDGKSYTTASPATAVTYYVAAQITATSCASLTRGSGTVTVHQKPGPPDVNIFPNP